MARKCVREPSDVVHVEGVSDDVKKLEPERVFIGWDRPVVEAVVDGILEGKGEGMVDLSELMVVVPTKHAGRRLRAALAERCPAGVLSPVVVPPEYFLGVTGEEAGRAATLLAWVEVLMEVNLRQYGALFPVEPVERNFSWALGLAEMLEGVRATLAEGGKKTAEAEEHLRDPLRWKDFGRLEEQVVARLEKRELVDAQAAKIAAAHKAALPNEIQRVVVAGVPDALHLAEVALARHLKSGVPVVVWVSAPGGMEKGFDAWGRPTGDFWRERDIEIVDFEERVVLAPDPAGQAERAGEFLRCRENAVDRAVALGVLDAEVVAPLTQVLHAGGLGVFDPDGKTLERDPVFCGVASFSKLLSDRRWESFRELIRQPTVLDALAAVVEKGGEEDLFAQRKLDRSRILAAFDSLHQYHLPTDFDAVREAATGKVDDFEFRTTDYAMPTVVNEVEALMRVFAKQTFDDGIRALGKFLGVDSEVFVRLGAIAEEVGGYLGGRRNKKSVPNADLLAFCVTLLSSEHTYPPRSEEVEADLLGWLELLWEDSPDLVVTGFNESNVPDAIVGDPFLPETARETLGLRTNAGRFARDAYLFEALAAQRKSEGQLHLILGKTARDGTPMKPSRLLFQCPDSELATRTARLFGEPGETASSARGVPAWERTWLFAPPADLLERKLKDYMSVTHFSSYLDCPFRFFLKNRLRMESLEIGKSEMDARDFGTVVHIALEVLLHDPTARDSTDAEEISGFLVGALDVAIDKRYGARLPTALAMQREVALQRLGRVAEIQAVERASGWRIEEVELDFGRKPAWGASLAGLPIHGSIDRVEKHEDGRVRILDYKTSKVASSPEDAHLKKLPRGKSGEDYPDWRVTSDAKSKPALWTNLQLPLYVLWARTRFPDAAISCGYFNIPASLGDIGIATWDLEHFSDILDSAQSCASAVGEAVRSNVFWPPEEKPKYDDFAALAPVGTLEEATDSEAWTAAFAALPTHSPA